MKIDVLKPRDARARVYQYGIRVDDDCIGRLEEQFWAAHETYNNIVAEIRGIVSEAIAWLEENAGEEAKSLRERIPRLNEQWDGAKALDDREALRGIAEERRGLWRQWYQLMHEARRGSGDELKSLFLDRIGERKECGTYQIRSIAVNNGLGWATGNAVLKAAIQAYKKQWPKFKLPNFRRIADVTQKTLELQFTPKGGISVADILDGYREVSMNISKASRRTYSGFRMRVGSGKIKGDVIGTVYYHRPMPPEGRVKYARLVERRIGKDRRYYIQFVVTDIEEDTGNTSGAKKQLAALDFGWYFEDDGRRIAGFADSGDPAAAKVLRLPHRVDELFDRSEQMKAKRDSLRDEIVAELKGMDFENPPEEIAEYITKIKRLPVQYVASSLLARLTLSWRRLAASYEAPVFDRLEDWYLQDRMHWQAESHLASRGRNMRKKHYEKLALGWAMEYETIIIDTPELSETAIVKNKTTGRHNKLGGVARGGRVRAALYDLRQAIENAAARYGVKVATIQGRTSKTCSLCGGTMSGEDGGRELVCGSCGARLDREQNAAAVVWQEGMKQLETINEKYNLGKEAHEETLVKRKARQAARQSARWSARNGSGLEIGVGSRDSEINELQPKK